MTRNQIAFQDLLESVRHNKRSEYLDKYRTDKQYSSTLKSAAMHLRGTIYSADAHSAASRYAADKSAAASMYGADQAAAASRYGADQAAAASRYGADRAVDAAYMNNIFRQHENKRDRFQKDYLQRREHKWKSRENTRDRRKDYIVGLAKSAASIAATIISKS